MTNLLKQVTQVIYNQCQTCSQKKKQPTFRTNAEVNFNWYLLLTQTDRPDLSIIPHT